MMDTKKKGAARQFCAGITSTTFNQQLFELFEQKRLGKQKGKKNMNYDFGGKTFL